jgi:acetyl esterase/lipase
MDNNIAVKIKVNKKWLIIFLAYLFIAFGYAQEYAKTVLKLWEADSIPFNKQIIKVSEKLDSAGIRYTQISEPLLYVYKKNNPNKNGAGLLFCPGGGYSKVTIGENDGEQTAEHFLNMGFNVVAVLKYRLPDTLIVNSQDKVPLCDAQKAMALMHKNADDWFVNNNKIAVMGGSAGGHLAASLANLQDTVYAPNVTKNELKHAVSILMYPVISFNLPYRHKGSFRRLLANQSNNQELLDYYSMENRVNLDTPATFIVHALDDVGVVYQNSLLYCEALKKFDINYKYLELEKGGHGFGLNFTKTGVDWTIALKDWLTTETQLFYK